MLYVCTYDGMDVCMYVSMYVRESKTHRAEEKNQQTVTIAKLSLSIGLDTVSEYWDKKRTGKKQRERLGEIQNYRKRQETDLQ
jgi:hypothetical protein